MCSACHQRGHTQTSRICPQRGLSSIASKGLLLRDIKVQQASQVIQNSHTLIRLVVQLLISPLDSFQTAPLFSDSFWVSETQKTPENDFSVLNALTEVCPITPQRIFCILLTILLLMSSKHHNQASLNLSLVLLLIQFTFVQLD